MYMYVYLSIYLYLYIDIDIHLLRTDVTLQKPSTAGAGARNYPRARRRATAGCTAHQRRTAAV